MALLPEVELVDAGGIHADCLGGTDDIEAHVAHGDGREAAVDIVLAVAVNHVERAPLLLLVAAALQDAGAGDVGRHLAAGIEQVPAADGADAALVEGEVVG